MSDTRIIIEVIDNISLKKVWANEVILGGAYYWMMYVNDSPFCYGTRKEIVELMSKVK